MVRHTLTPTPQADATPPIGDKLTSPTLGGMLSGGAQFQACCASSVRLLFALRLRSSGAHRRWTGKGRSAEVQKLDICENLHYLRMQTFVRASKRALYPVPVYNAISIHTRLLPALRAYLGRHRHVAVGDVLDERCVCVVQHDVKVLDCMHTLQAPPVLEPGNVVGLHSAAERLVHERVHLLVRLGRRETCLGVFVQLELGPDDKVHYPVVNAVRPVVVQNLDVLFTNELAHPSCSHAA